MSVTVRISADSASRAVGANALAAALTAAAAARGLPFTLLRPGSRGLYFLEPLLEVETAAGTALYGPVTAADIPGLLDAGVLDGGASPKGRHPKGVGLLETLPAWTAQRRIVFQRCGSLEPLDLDAYQGAGGGAGLRRALTLTPDALIADITASGLRGRGGAGFPTGIKWHGALAAAADRKYVVCNADEGDSGTFADRMLMEGDPFVLIEGMIIAGLAIGAERGFIYLRSEYPDAARTMTAALRRAAAVGWLGADILGSGRRFDLDLRLGAGAYICGEETALLNSLEGLRGVIRQKPPLPTEAGLFGAPTVVNNVITLATVPAILAHGAAAHGALGVGRSLGTLTLQLCGDVRRPGLYELPFGMSLHTAVETLGGGSASGRPLRAAQIGGPLGAYLPAARFDVALDYEALAAVGAMLGHGGVVLFGDDVDMLEQARFAMAFCAHESCGKCTPCRIGSVRGVEVIDRLRHSPGDADAAQLLRDLCAVMRDGSLCAMGGLTPAPVLSALDCFGEDFGFPATQEG